jgi:hypothetical protein
LLFIIYTINLPVVRPRSCRVIYYFDTPALGRRHQSFGRVRVALFWTTIVETKPITTTNIGTQAFSFALIV